jgi:hypothetical protein
MNDVQDMTDDEILLDRARQGAARRYRIEGFNEFADRVERGEVDDCQEMRVVRFFHEPTPPHTDAFIEAWNRAAAGLSAA